MPLAKEDGAVAGLRSSPCTSRPRDLVRLPPRYKWGAHLPGMHGTQTSSPARVPPSETEKMTKREMSTCTESDVGGRTGQYGSRGARWDTFAPPINRRNVHIDPRPAISFSVNSSETAVHEDPGSGSEHWNGGGKKGSQHRDILSSGHSTKRHKRTRNSGKTKKKEMTRKEISPPLPPHPHPQLTVGA